MASTPKPIYEKFVQDWNGRAGWAQSNGIPFNDFAQVMKFDYNRMTNSQGYGTKMSDTEAFDAMASLKTGHNPFTTPADTQPNFLTNPFGAIRNDVQGIVTGLFHAPEALYHDAVDAAHGHFGGIASLIPGYTDVTDLFSSQGRQYLMEHPISDLLDVGGIGKIADIGEAGLRSVGAVNAADLLSKMPDHPAARMMSANFNKAANNIVAIKSLQEHGTSILGHAGQLKSQVVNIFRPMRAAQDLIKRVSMEYITDLSRRIQFGETPTGTPVIAQMQKILEGKSDADVNAAIEMYNFSEHNGSQMSRYQFLHDPTISRDAKNVYRSFAELESSLELAEWLKENAIKPVYHKFTNKQGWVKTEDSDWDKFEKRFDKITAKLAKNQSDLGTVLQTIFQSLKHIKDEDAGLPQALRLNATGPIPLPTALRRTADYFRVNGHNLFQGDLSDAVGKRRYSYHNRRVEELFGNDGVLIRLVNNLGSLRNAGDSSLIMKDIRSIRTSINKLNIPHDEIWSWLNDTLNDVQNTVVDMADAQSKVGRLDEEYKATNRRYNTIRKSYDLNWNRMTQQRYAALAQREMIRRVGQYLTEHFRHDEFHARMIDGKEVITATPEMIDRAIREAENSNFGDPSVQALMPRSEWTKIQNEAWLNVSDLQAAGYDPFFVTAVTTQDKRIIGAGGGASLGDVAHYDKRSAQFERVPSLTNTLYDPRIGIPKEAIGIYRQHIIQQLIDNFFSHLAMTKDDLIAESRYFWTTKGLEKEAYADTQLAAEEYASKHGYVPWNPNNPLGLESVDVTSPNKNVENTLWIKSYNKKMLVRTVKELDQSLNLAYNTLMQAYRLGVLYMSPRYAAHITLGGGLMTVLRLQHPILTPLRYGREMWRQTTDPNFLPAFVTKGVSEQGVKGELVANPFGGHNFLVGRKVGQLYHEARNSRLGKVSSVLESYKELLEHVSNFQRSLALIEGEMSVRPEDITEADRMEAARWNTTPEKWIGGKAAQKVLADMQTVSPMERAIIMRYVMPFWGWTKHILRYVTTYPVDHPLRASVVMSLSNQAIGQDSLLPNYLFRLLFLGQPNAQGNVTVIDDRQWNPFRDIANYMTWGGIMSQLNPVLQAVTASAWGVNSATGGPDLFPQLTYDAFYGSDTAAPSGGNFFVDVAKQISPQIDTLLEIAKKTSSLRQQAYANPGSLPYLIGDSLGLPWIPKPINVKQIQIKGTTDQEALASAAVQQSLQQNSLAPLQGYSGLLPYSGYEVNKGYLQELINQALAYNKANNTNISAYDLIALPYASQYAPEYLLANPSNKTG